MNRFFVELEDGEEWLMFAPSADDVATAFLGTATLIRNDGPAPTSAEMIRELEEWSGRRIQATGPAEETWGALRKKAPGFHSTVLDFPATTIADNSGAALLAGCLGLALALAFFFAVGIGSLYLLARLAEAFLSA